MPGVVDDDLRRAIDDGDFYSFHRDKRGDDGTRGLALVARPVKPKEVKSNPTAQATCDMEHNAFCDSLKVGVKEWSDIQAQARKTGERIHVGMIFGICVEKNAELP